MPAGRPRKYHNKEDKEEAHRRAVARYYYRNRVLIGAERKVKRDADRELRGLSDTPQLSAREQTDDVTLAEEIYRFPGDSVIVHSDESGGAVAEQRHGETEIALTESRSELATGRLSSLENRLAKITKGRTDYTLLHDICTEFVDRMKVDVLTALDSFLDPVGELSMIVEASGNHAKTTLDAEAEDEEDAAKALEIYKRAEAIHTVLEELLSEAIMGPEAFADDFHQLSHKFQLIHTET